jgi:hypothetical protein
LLGDFDGFLVRRSRVCTAIGKQIPDNLSMSVFNSGAEIKAGIFKRIHFSFPKKSANCPMWPYLAADTNAALSLGGTRFLNLFARLLLVNC